MGMSIDKAILRIEHSWMSDDDKETADFIINTIRKYQKIEQIVNDELEDFHPLDRNPYKIALIKKEIGI